ncbi:MAG: PilN domain-containing protein [bacterium]|jgi:Tfp pilus assembly protein PilN
MSKPTNASFLPEDYLQRKRESKALILNLVLFAGMISAVGGAFLVTDRQWSAVHFEQAEVGAEYAREAAKIEQLKVMEAQKQQLLYRAEVTTALIERVPRSILLAEIVNRLPEGITLTDLVMESTRVAPPAPPKDAAAKSLADMPVAAKDPKAPPPKPKPPTLEFKLLIAGLAPTDTFVADFQSNLKKCPLLDRVDLVSTVELIDKDRTLRRFRLEASIKPDADTWNIKPLAVRRANAAMSLQASPAGVKRGASPGGPDWPRAGVDGSDDPGWNR